MIKIKFGKGSVKEATEKDVKADELTDSDIDLLKTLDLKDVELNDLDRAGDYQFMLDSGYIPVERPSTHTKITPKVAKGKGEKPEYSMSALLGAGAFGTVYEATKAGTDRRYAVKITSDPQEFRVRTRIEGIRESLPPEVAQHFVKMEEVKEEIPSADKKVSTYRSPVVNRLIALQLVRPMNSVEQTALFRGTAGLERFIANFKGQDKITDFKSYKASFDSGLRRAPVPELMKFFPRKMFPNTVEARKAFEKFADLLLNDLEEALDKFGEDNYVKIAKNTLKVAEAAEIHELVGLYKFTQIEVVKNLLNTVLSDGDKIKTYSQYFSPKFVPAGDITDILHRDITIMLTSDYLVNHAVIQFRKVSGLDNATPKKSEITMRLDYNDIASTLTGGDRSKFDDENYILNKLEDFDMPEKVRSLMYALLYVAAKHGIYFADMHEKNIMVDPRTGEYMVVDVGMFRMASQLKMLDKGMKENLNKGKLIISVGKSGKNLVG